VENCTRSLIFSTCVSVFLFTACVSGDTPLGFKPGKHSNYRALLVSMGAYTKFPTGTPQSVKDRYSECAADFVLSGVSPVDLPKLDAYAQGRQDLTVNELNRINAGIEAKLGRPLTQGGLERLTPFCPDDVPDFMKWPPYS
jgi:hypothetical protein